MNIRQLAISILTIATLFCSLSLYARKTTVNKPDFAFPKTVTQQSEANLDKALRSNDGQQIIRSFIDLALAQGAIGQDNIPMVVKRIKEVAENQESPETKALLNILLAKIHLETYMRNDHTYNSRSIPLTPLSEDWTEWSGEQFRNVIEELCNEALKNKSALQSAGLSDYSDIITADKQTFVYYPTLYDFIASQVIEIRSRLSYFGNCLSITLLTGRDAYILKPRYVANNKNIKAILDIYADLLSFHATDTAPLINTDIERIKFICENIYYVQETNAEERKKALLMNLYDEYRERTEYSGDILNVMDIDDDKKCYDMLNAFLAKYPSYWRRECLKNIITRLSQPSLSCSAPAGATPGKPIKIQVKATNVNSSILTIYRADDAKIKPIESGIVFRGANAVPVKSMTLKFPGETPFTCDTVVSVTLPEYGCYFASLTMPGDKPAANQYFELIRCTDLATASSNSSSPVLIVYNPLTGQPVEKATLSEYDNDDQKRMTVGMTDKNGFMPCPAKLRDYKSLYPSKGKDLYGFPISFNRYIKNTEQLRIENNAYCDLPVYHPGDTVRWVNIIYGYSQSERKLLPGQKMRAVLHNANYIAIDTIEAVTDRFGRIESSFAIPEGELTGDYTISFHPIDYDPEVSPILLDRLNFMVSDYKMPTFKVSISNVVNDMPAKGAVTLHGRVETYSGMGLGEVNLTLNLSVGPFSFRYSSNSVDFYSTTATSLPDGSFSIELPAELFDNSPMPGGRYSARLTAMSSSGESQETTRYFTRGAAYIIEAHVNDNSDAIDASKSIKTKISVLDGMMKPVVMPLILKITDASADTIVARIPVSSADSTLNLSAIPSGEYDFEFTPADKEINSSPATLSDIVLYRPNDRKSPVDDPLWLAQNSRTLNLQPGEKTKITYAVPENGSYVLYTLSSGTTVIEQKWLTANAGVHQIEITMPKNIQNATITLMSCRNFRSVSRSVNLQCPEPEKDLRIICETFRNRIIPGDEETWTFRTVDGNGSSRESAMILGMYNSALDAIISTTWGIDFRQPYLGSCDINLPFHINSFVSYQTNLRKYQLKSRKCPQLTIPELNTYGRSFYPVHIHRYRNMIMRQSATEKAYRESPISSADKAVELAEIAEDEAIEPSQVALAGSITASEESGSEAIIDHEADVTAYDNQDSGQTVQAEEPFSYRENNVTTAFFRPMLDTDSEGRLSFTFRVPNANTTWKLQALAYTDKLSSTALRQMVLANKPIMVTPNLPRFMRSGDKMTINALILNNSDKDQTVTTTIEIFNPATKRIIDSRDTIVTIAPNTTSTASIQLTAPLTDAAIGYRIKSSTDRYADGEQALIPILKSVTPVIETIPFYISPDSARYSMTLPKLSGDAVVNLQYCDNPIWYSVTALPGLRSAAISTPTDAASAIFSAAVAEGIMRQNPIIANALHEWMSSDRSDSTLVSMLQRNSDLKTMLLQATPWVVDAMSDTERMERLALLFDKNEIENVYSSAVATLRKLQRNGGGWAWIDMCNDASEWATGNALYILGYLNRLGYLPDNKQLNSMIGEALSWHQKETEKAYRKYPKDSYYEYLQIRDLWPEYKPSLTGKTIINKEIQKIVKNWKSYDIANKACCTTLLYHNGYKALAKKMLASIREFSESSPTKGMWWPSTGDVYGGQLIQLSIAANVLLAIHEIEPESPDINSIRQWLILQKEAQNWGVGSMPSQIITAILTTSPKWIEKAGTTTVSINGRPLDISYSDATLGYFRANISNLNPSEATLTIEKSKLSPAWGAVYSRSIETMTDVKPSSCEAVSIEKRMYRQVESGWKEASSLKVGDRVKIQLLIHANRDMQYMAIDDDRAACLEPVEQLPKPIYAEGICFYRENRDASTNMFVTNMPKGTYLLEYELWVNNAGVFSSGIATIQSQYAPQLSAHSSGSKITVAN